MAEADFPAWVTALNASRERRLLVIGDSVLEGFDSGGTAATQDQSTMGFCERLAAALTLINVRYIAHPNAWIGESVHTLTNLKLTRPRLSGGTGWVDANSGNQVTGGSYIWNFGGGGNPLLWAPSIAFDTFRLHYIGGFADTVTFSSDDLVAWTGSPLTTGGASRHAISTFTTGTSAVRQCQASSNAASLFVIGLDLSDSTIPRTQVMKACYFGSTTLMWLSTVNAYSSGKTGANSPVQALDPDLVAMMLGINDMTGGVTAATYETRLSSLVDIWVGEGASLCLFTCNPISTASVASATQDAFAQKVRDVATAKGVQLYDIYARWGSYTSAVTNGYMSLADTLHPTALGHIDMANGFADLITGSTARNMSASINIGNSVLDSANGIETGVSVRSALRLITSATAGKVSGAQTPTITLRNGVADTKSRIVADVDEFGNRSAITYDLSD